MAAPRAPCLAAIRGRRLAFTPIWEIPGAGRACMIQVYGARAVTLAIAMMLAWAVLAPAAAQGVCANPRQMEGFKTCADIGKAEQEGGLVLYSPDPEDNSARLMEAFHKVFPKITTNFIRLQ